VLLFGVATAIDVFQDRLQQSTIRCLAGSSFKAVQSQELLERIFAATIVGSSVPFRIGPDLISAILKRPKENIQSPNEFIDAFQASGLFLHASSSKQEYSTPTCATFTQTH
jgi:origin recognition complex subunit 3